MFQKHVSHIISSCMNEWCSSLWNASANMQAQHLGWYNTFMIYHISRWCALGVALIFELQVLCRSHKQFDHACTCKIKKVEVNKLYWSCGKCPFKSNWRKMSPSYYVVVGLIIKLRSLNDFRLPAYPSYTWHSSWREYCDKRVHTTHL
jgi:hypothetical protein